MDDNEGFCRGIMRVFANPCKELTATSTLSSLTIPWTSNLSNVGKPSITSIHHQRQFYRYS